MQSRIPSAEQVRARLKDLNLSQIGTLASLSGVPVATIYKIRIGQTSNPGIETVRKFMPHVREARRA